MSRRTRARSFLFEPGRFKNDEAVLRMSLEARGAYAILFCELWDQPEPGVVLDDDRLLASLARATPDEWARIGSDVRLAFDSHERPGHLIQCGLVATARAQDSFVASQSHAGHVAANVRWAKEKDAKRMRSASESGCGPNSPSVLGSRFSDVPVNTEARASKRFAPPTLEQVAAYCAERKNAVDPQAWLDHYEANGWKVGRSPMKSWRAAVRTWERNDLANGNGSATSTDPKLYTHCTLCHYGPLEQERSKREGLCGSCRSNQAALNAM